MGAGGFSLGIAGMQTVVNGGTLFLSGAAKSSRTT